MTIRHRLSLGFGMVALTVVGLGILAIVSMNSMSMMTMTMYDQVLMGSTFTKSATARFFKIREHFQRATTLDEDARDEILEAIEEEQVRFIEDLVVVQERYLDSRIQERVPVLIENIKSWTTALTVSLETSGTMSDKGKSQGPQEMMRGMEDTLSFLTRVVTDAGFVRRVEAEEQSQTLLMATIATIISALLIVVGIAWMICGPMVGRLAQIEKILLHATQGNFSGRTDFNQRDEIGRIGSHLNELFNTVSRVVSGVCQTAEYASAAAIGTDDHLRDTSPSAPKLNSPIVTKVPKLTKDGKSLT